MTVTEKNCVVSGFSALSVPRWCSGARNLGVGSLQFESFARLTERLWSSKLRPLNGVKSAEEEFNMGLVLEQNQKFDILQFAA